MTGMPYPIDGVQEGDRALLAQMTREQLTIAAAQVNLHHKQLQRSILGMGADQELLNKRSLLSRSQAELDKSLASNPQLATPFLRVESWIKSALAGDGSALRALQGVAGATLAKQAQVELGERPQINSPPEPFANAIEGLGSSVATPVAKPLYQHHYRPDGSVDKSSVQYRAEGQRIESNFDDGATVAAMLDLAARSGWTAIKTRGSSVFRQAVFIEAMARGIQVFGYNPTNAELAEGLQRAEARGNATAAHRSPEAQAFIEAQSQEERKRTAATYPELGKAFVLLASAEKWASSVLRPQDAATFTERIRNNIAQDLDSGITLPAIQLRETQLAARSAQAR